MDNELYQLPYSLGTLSGKDMSEIYPDLYKILKTNRSLNHEYSNHECSSIKESINWFNKNPVNGIWNINEEFEQEIAVKMGLSEDVCTTGNNELSIFLSMGKKINILDNKDLEIQIPGIISCLFEDIIEELPLLIPYMNGQSKEHTLDHFFSKKGNKYIAKKSVLNTLMEILNLSDDSDSEDGKNINV